MEIVLAFSEKKRPHGAMLPAARLIEFSALKMRKTEQKVASEKVTETQQRRRRRMTLTSDTQSHIHERMQQSTSVAAGRPLAFASADAPQHGPQYMT